MLYQMIRREGWRVNHKPIERLYREEGLSLRRRAVACDRRPQAVVGLPIGKFVSKVPICLFSLHAVWTCRLHWPIKHLGRSREVW